MLIIGITGTLGAGKGTIVEYLTEKKNFRHYSVREYLIKEIDKQGLTVNRDSMTSVANRLRSEHHPAYIVEELYKQATGERKNAVIESIRTPGEVDFLRKQGSFYLFFTFLLWMPTQKYVTSVSGNVAPKPTTSILTHLQPTNSAK